MFLNKVFEYGGTIGNLDLDKGKYKGVYIFVLPKDFGKVDFNEHSNSGKFKGKDPTVSKDRLEKKWVGGAEILYIGKREAETVQHRVLEHIDFWSGKSVAAYGGRIIEQIQNYKNLEVWYLKCEDPSEMEKKLLREFAAQYKKLPYANWRF